MIILVQWNRSSKNSSARLTREALRQNFSITHSNTRRWYRNPERTVMPLDMEDHIDLIIRFHDQDDKNTVILSNDLLLQTIFQVKINEGNLDCTEFSIVSFTPSGVAITYLRSDGHVGHGGWHDECIDELHEKLLDRISEARDVPR